MGDIRIVLIDSAAVRRESAVHTLLLAVGDKHSERLITKFNPGADLLLTKMV